MKSNNLSQVDKEYIEFIILSTRHEFLKQELDHLYTLLISEIKDTDNIFESGSKAVLYQSYVREIEYLADKIKVLYNEISRNESE